MLPAAGSTKTVAFLLTRANRIWGSTSTSTVQLAAFAVVENSRCLESVFF
jgi:hypothetical protein